MSTADATSSTEHPPRTEAAAEVSATQIRSGSADVEVCPDEDEVLGFLDRRLDQERAEALERHVDRCHACRKMIGELAQDASDRTPLVEPAALRPGDQVDHFRIEALLGRGGMGEVYAAQDTKLRRKVALKLISRTLADSDEARARIAIEARAMARLNHPNIAAVYSSGEHQSRPYLALEYLDGPTLRERMDLGPLSLVETVRVAAAIASALAHAHQQHVVHRDLKPQNIILAADRPRVVDFGLAKLQRAPEIDSSFVTDDAGIRGTPAYIAPEHWRGHPSTEASDLWAFGVILYELISGRRPYREVSAAGYAARVSSSDPTPPLTRISGAPEALIGVAERCLAKEPSARGTAEDARRAIDLLAQDESLRVAADLDEAALRWESAGQSKDALWDAALVTRAERVLSAQALPMSGSAARFLSASIERARSHERRRSRRLSLLGGAASFCGLIAALLAVLAFQSASRAKQQERAVEAQRAQVLIEGAASALDQGSFFEARAKLRSGLESGDDVRARALWAAMASEPLLWKRKLSSGLFDVALSEDGSSIAAAAQDHTVYLLDARTLAVRSLRGHKDQVFKVAFSKDGRWLASSSWSGETRLWSLSDGSVRVLQGSKRALSMAFGDDVLFTTDGEGPLIAHPLDGKEPQKIGPNGARDVMVERGEAWIAYGDGKIRALDKEVADAGVAISAVAAGARWIAAGGFDGKITLFSRSGGDRLVLDAHSARVLRLRFAGADRLVSIAEDKTARLFDLSDSKNVVLGSADSAVWGLAIDAAGRRAFTAHVDGTVRAFDLARAANAASSTGPHSDGITSLSFSGSTIYTGGYDRTIRVWDGERGVPIAVLRGHEGTVYGLAQHRSFLVSSSHDRTVRIWELPSGRARAVLAGHEAGVYGVAIDPRGEWIASAGSDRTVRLWRLAEASAGPVLRGHGGAVVSVAWSPDGEQLASGGADKTIILWDRSGRELKRLIGHEGNVWSLSFDGSGKRLISTGYDKTVRVWDLKTGSSHVAARLDARAYGSSVAGERAYVAAADGRVHVVDLSAGLIASWSGHRAEVNATRVLGDRVASVSDDGTLRLWSAARGVSSWRGVLLDGARFYTQRGAIDLERGDLSAPSTELDRRLRDFAEVAARSSSGRYVCLAAGGAIELWEGERRVFSTPAERIESIAALENACVAITGGAARRFGSNGASTSLAADVRALFVDRARIAVATDAAIVRFDHSGARIDESALVLGATAITSAGDVWLVGFDNGRVERWKNGHPEPISFESPPGGRVVRLIAGPHDTVIAGYSGGELAIWSGRGGALLDERRLHGPVTFLSAEGGAIYAASELGDFVQPITVFRKSWCALLGEVRDEVPVVWKDGSAVIAGELEEHPCSER